VAIALSAYATSGGAAAGFGAILLAIGTSVEPVAHSALAAEAPSTVSGGGVTLHSVSTDLPVGDRTFPGGARADAINGNCLGCHSAGMVLTQPSLSRDDWQDEVNKMRHSYKAPVAQEDVPAIVEYLVSLSAERTRASHR
jgi:hypothetical protein